jgi:starch phosphorylase
VESNAKPVMQRGDFLTVKSFIELGHLTPEEITVELYYGAVSSKTNDIEKAERSEMKPIRNDGSCYEYQARIECSDTGMQGHTVRLLPKHTALIHPYRTGLIKWA